MEPTRVGVYLYGLLASRVVDKGDYGYAEIQVDVDRPGTMRHLLAQLGIATADRGITFINGKLSAVPGLQPDLEHILHRGDRVALFDLKSMWPFQYRSGASMMEELKNAVPPGSEGMRHSYEAQS